MTRPSIRSPHAARWLPAFGFIAASLACSKEADSGAAPEKEEGSLFTAARGALGEASKSLEQVELVGAELLERASGMVAEVAKELGAIKDSATAKAMSAKAAPLLDKLLAAKESLGKKVDLAPLRDAATALRARFKDDASLTATLKPLLDKLDALTGETATPAAAGGAPAPAKGPEKE